MGAKRLENLVAYQFAVEFNGEVQQLIKASPAAQSDWEFRRQLQGAASGIDGSVAEGYARFRPAEVANFLTYALASLAEAKARIKNGVLRGYFREADVQHALTWAERCRVVMIRLLASQRRLIEQQREEENRRRLERTSRRRSGPHGVGRQDIKRSDDEKL